MGTVTRSGGHALGSLSHAGPFHHSCFSSVTGPPRLARSAGLSLVGTCLHVMSPCSLIFRTQFATNCLKSPFPRIQCSATLLSSQQCREDTGNPCSASCTLLRRFTAMWPETSSRWGIVNPCFASLAFAVTRPWFTEVGCLTTAYTAAATPFPLASPKAWSSMFSIGCWALVSALGQLICWGEQLSHFFHCWTSSADSGASHAHFSSQASRYSSFPCRVVGAANPKGS